MKNKALVIALSLFLAQTPLKATPIAGNEIPLGFVFGYTTGLIPVVGQGIFPLIVMGTDAPNANTGLLIGSALVGHVAGIATICTACYYGIRKTYRFLTQPEKITTLQLILAAHQQ